MRQRALVLVWVLVCVLMLAGARGRTASAGPAPSVGDLAREAPRMTSVMRQREAEARKAGRTPVTDYRWVPLSRIAPVLRHAVVASEDAQFYRHGGLDVTEIRASAAMNVRRGTIVRGGSTLTQQLAKNLYLSTSRSVLRKAEEAVLALRIERALSKRRILELYLNVIEWGDGIYGAEAAAQHYFGVRAADLTTQQAAVLTALIPSPRRDDPAKRSARLVRRYRTVLLRLRQSGAISRSAYRELRRAPWELKGSRRHVSPPPQVSPPPTDSTHRMPAVLAPPETASSDSGGLR